MKDVLWRPSRTLYIRTGLFRLWNGFVQNGGDPQLIFLDLPIWCGWSNMLSGCHSDPCPGAGWSGLEDDAWHFLVCRGVTLHTPMGKWWWITESSGTLFLDKPMHICTLYIYIYVSYTYCYRYIYTRIHLCGIYLQKLKPSISDQWKFLKHFHSKETVRPAPKKVKTTPGWDTGRNARCGCEGGVSLVSVAFLHLLPLRCKIPSGYLTYLLNMATYAEFTHSKWWCLTCMFVYQRVDLAKNLLWNHLMTQLPLYSTVGHPAPVILLYTPGPRK